MRGLWRIIALTLCCYSSNSQAQSISVIDDAGRQVTLTGPAQRIISLAPSLTELLFVAGAGNRIVGVSEYSDYPPQAQGIPVVGRYNLLDMEAIVAFGPDLIVAWQSGNPQAAVQRLIDLGFNVYIAEPRTLTSIAHQIENFGQLAGTQSTSDAASRYFNEQLDTLQSRYEDASEVSVFYQVWNEPLISVGGDELINDIITLCGGHNIFSDQGLAPKISIESVLARDPETIIASGMDIARPEWLDDWRRWPQMQAVSNDHLYFIPPDLVQRHSLRVLSGALQMCAHLDKVRSN
ncbi:MAG: cobalamin-binding protein [Gammaproteobacteria bacterium]